MKIRSSQNNTPRNTIILATIVTILLGIFRLVLFLVLVWIAALIFIIVYQYKASKSNAGNFVCLDCATIHQDLACPKCGSKLKKIYSKDNKYGI
ncbi:MAG: hypothetical protein WA833_06630 [Nitrosotalea sp.]